MLSQQLQASQSAARLARRWSAWSPVLLQCARICSNVGDRVLTSILARHGFYLEQLLLGDTVAEVVLAAFLQAAGGGSSNSEPAAGTGPTSGSASQPQSQGRQRITLLLEAWTQQWRATQLPKQQAAAYRCILQFRPCVQPCAKPNGRGVRSPRWLKCWVACTSRLQCHLCLGRIGSMPMVGLFHLQDLARGQRAAVQLAGGC